MPDKKPVPPPKKKLKLGGLKNWVILGVAGIAAVVVYKKFVAPDLKNIKSDLKSAANKKAGVPGPDLNGPAVTKFMIASTRTNICIDTALPGFTYAPITSTNSYTGYRTFTSPVNGHFTRRELCKGNQRWAEIKAS